MNNAYLPAVVSIFFCGEQTPENRAREQSERRQGNPSIVCSRRLQSVNNAIVYHQSFRRLTMVTEKSAGLLFSMLRLSGCAFHVPQPSFPARVLQEASRRAGGQAGRERVGAGRLGSGEGPMQ